MNTISLQIDWNTSLTKTMSSVCLFIVSQSLEKLYSWQFLQRQVWTPKPRRLDRQSRRSLNCFCNCLYRADRLDLTEDLFPKLVEQHRHSTLVLDRQQFLLRPSVSMANLPQLPTSVCRSCSDLRRNLERQSEV